MVIDKTISLIGEDASCTKIILHPAWVTEWIFASPLSYYIHSMRIDADDVKLGGFTILSDGWDILVNGDRAQIMGNTITMNLVMKGSYQTVAYNKITSSFYPNGTLKFYGHVDLCGNYCRATANTLVNGGICAYGTCNTIFANTGTGSLSAGGTSWSNLIYANTLKDGGSINIGSIGNIIANNIVTNGTSGIAVNWGSGNIITGNTITNCSGTGLTEIDNAGNNTFYSNHVANNLCGAKIAAWRSYNTSLYHNNFFNNAKQVNCDANEDYTSAGLDFTRKLNHGGLFDYGKEGNYWSDYHGKDADGNGIGDTPYVIDDNRSDRYPLMAPFDISSVTIQLPEWANITLPSPLQTPSFPPSPYPSPSLTPSPNPSPTLSPSPSPTKAPPEAEPKPFLTALVATASVASVAIIGVVLLTYFKKRKR